MINIRRIYEPGTPDEKYRILVDRLWPRGISKEKAGWDEWLKDIAPGNDLRKWYNHDPARWEEFRKRYLAELTEKYNELRRLKQLELTRGNLTLLTTTGEKVYNHAVVLKELLDNLKYDAGN